MKTTLINTSSSSVSKMYESKMLWSVILFTEKIYWASPHAMLSNCRFTFKRINERTKMNHYKYFLKYWNVDITPDQLEERYQLYLKYKNKKHKNRKELEVIMSGKKMMNDLEIDTMRFIEANEESLGITELSSFMDLKDAPLILPLNIGVYNPEVGKKYSDVEIVSSTMYYVNEIPIFSDAIEKHLSFKRFSDYVSKQYFIKNKLVALKEKFIEITAPNSLTTNQVLIIRNELTDEFKYVMSDIENFHQDFIEKKLNNKDLKKIKSFILDVIIPYFPEIQKAIDNNIYINQLKNKVDNITTYVLYLGLTTVKNLVEVYKRLNILNDNSALYCRDELQQKGVLDALKFFVYLKEEVSK